MTAHLQRARLFLSARPAAGVETAAVSAVRDAARVTGTVGVRFSGAAAVLPGLCRTGSLRPGIILGLLSLRLLGLLRLGLLCLRALRLARLL